MRKVALVLAAVVVACTPQRAAPTPASTAAPYPVFRAAIGFIVEQHVDSPSQRSLLEAATAAVAATTQQRSFTSVVAAPSYVGDPKADLDRFTSYLDAVHALVPSITGEDLERIALKGATTVLHPCEGDRYVPPGDLLFPPTQAFGGIGVLLRDPSADSAGLPWFGAVFPDGPAERAGIMAGDRLRTLNGRNVAGFSAQETSDVLKGPEGSLIELVVVGPSGERAYSIRRALIRTPALVARIIDEGYGYVQPNGYPADAQTELRDLLARWNAAGVRGWVLDLRGAGGGDLQTGYESASALIDSGALVLRQERGAEPREITVSGQSAHPQRPLAVLIGSGTNAISLMIATAVKEHDRGRLFGEPADGCAPILRPNSLPNGGMQYVVVARFLSAVTRQPIQTIAPDQRVPGAGDGTDHALAAAVAWLRAQPRP